MKCNGCVSNIKKFFQSIYIFFKRSKWETVYASECTCSMSSLIWGTCGRVNARVAIQVERTKNKARALLCACGDSNTIPIWQVCINNPTAQQICMRENITY